MADPWQAFHSSATETSIDCASEQWQWLQRCLRRNRDCVYGRLHGFAAIANIADFQKLPIVDYQALEPWIADMLQGREDQLFSGPAIAFERTGGSHSGGKLIPYSQAGLEDFREALCRWLADTIDDHQLSDGYAYWALSPALSRQQSTAAGIPIGGGDALYLGPDYLQAFIDLSAVPLSIAGISDLNQWQRVTLHHLLCCHDLRLISVWSPSFFQQLLDAIDSQSECLLRGLIQGDEVAGHVLEKDHNAAQRLHRYLHSRDCTTLWPRLALLSCWADASSQAPAKALAARFPQAILQPKGLLSTEGIVTTPQGQHGNRLCSASNFYEFIAADGHIHLAHELANGTDYRVLITTNSGLYRYDTADLVRCTGHHCGRPLLTFLGRTGVFSDLVGEKLDEIFTQRCLEEIDGFSMLCPEPDGTGYRLIIENRPERTPDQCAAIVERALWRNPQYAYARRLGQLSPVQCEAVEQPLQRYHHWHMQQGRRLGDIKLTPLLREDWRQVFKDR